MQIVPAFDPEVIGITAICGTVALVWGMSFYFMRRDIRRTAEAVQLLADTVAELHKRLTRE